MAALQDLAAAGQSVWYDNIRRNLLGSGELASYLDRCAVTGVTSNPTIFEQASPAAPWTRGSRSPRWSRSAHCCRSSSPGTTW